MQLYFGEQCPFNNGPSRVFVGSLYCALCKYNNKKILKNEKIECLKDKELEYESSSEVAIGQNEGV